MFRTLFILAFTAIGFIAYGQSTYEDLNEKVTQLVSAGKYQEALPLAIQEKDYAVNKYGDTSANILTALNNLAYIYEHQKNTMRLKIY